MRRSADLLLRMHVLRGLRRTTSCTMSARTAAAALRRDRSARHDRRRPRVRDQAIAVGQARASEIQREDVARIARGSGYSAAER
jgi:hypothetical protein